MRHHSTCSSHHHIVQQVGLRLAGTPGTCPVTAPVHLFCGEPLFTFERCHALPMSPGCAPVLGCGYCGHQVIGISNQENSTGCTPLCVSDASGSDSYITCRAQVPIAIGNVTVSVAGLVSQSALYDYEVRAVLAS